jgi:hypothetical protein
VCEPRPWKKASIRMSLGTIERSGKATSSSSRELFTERGALRIFVRGDSFFANWRDSVVALATPAAPPSSLPTKYFLRGAPATRVNFDGRPVAASFLLHCSLVALVIYLPLVVPAETSSMFPIPAHAEIIYYRIPRLDTVKMPRLAPTGPGGRPGSGSVSVNIPALGSAAPHLSMTIVSKPVHPDNVRQTIYHPSSPPDLKINTDQNLPNIVLAHPPEPLKAQVDLTLARPTQANRQISAMAAPAVNVISENTVTTLLKPSNTQPRLAIPLTGGGAPIRRYSDDTGSVAGEPSADAPDLIVLGVDSADSITQLSLPGGNRWGEFSIAPPSGTLGSPGGDPRGAVGGGSGGGTLGGDGSSTGVGFGARGGGGNSATPAPVSIAGSGARGPSAGLLDPSLPINMVYAVAASAINVRNSALVISAGPIGGGGLNLYGALKCGKVYSIFLPMPGKNWSLQYCDKSASTEKVASEGGITVVHLDTPLVPPDLDLGHRFNFKRISVPPEKSHRTIILKGVIAVDGTVQNLIVYQGVVSAMDEAARIAFSRWHFKPALKDGKPVEVEVLVGIPPLAEDDRISH